MIQAQRVLEEEMRNLSISWFYRPHDNEGKRGDFLRQSQAEPYSLIYNNCFLMV
jgi:hypothetical protein